MTDIGVDVDSEGDSAEEEEEEEQQQQEEEEDRKLGTQHSLESSSSKA